MKMTAPALLLLVLGFASVDAAEVRVREVQLIACTPVGMPDGKRVLQRYAPSKERCKHISQSVLVYVAEFGEINALCAYRSDDGCTRYDEMTAWEREQFEYMRGFIRIKNVFRTCTIEGTDHREKLVWRMEMLTVNGDCKPSVNAQRHWDFMQKKVYIRDGEETLGVIRMK